MPRPKKPEAEKKKRTTEYMQNYFIENREDCTALRIKNKYRKEVGKEIVDRIYEVADGDMALVRQAVDALRAAKKANQIRESLPENLRRLFGGNNIYMPLSIFSSASLGVVQKNATINRVKNNMLIRFFNIHNPKNPHKNTPIYTSICAKPQC